MGIYSRDYLREDYSPHGGSWSSAGVIKWLIIVNIAVFVLQVVWQRTVPVHYEHPQLGVFSDEIREPVVNQWFTLERSAIFGGQIWRLLTYEFLHDHTSPWHLFWNMVFLYLAGRKVADYYGPREFLLFYLVAGVLSGVFSVFWYEQFGPPGWSAVGASGAVAAVFLVYALHWPFDVWRLFLIIPVYAIWLALFCVVIDVFPLLVQLGGNPWTDGVAHSAHVGGMLFGLLYQRRNWRLEPLLTRFRWADWKRRLRLRLRPRPKLRVYQPTAERDDAEWESRVDKLLQKVAEQGEASLTDSERQVLVEASRRYRNRQR